MKTRKEDQPHPEENPSYLTLLNQLVMSFQISPKTSSFEAPQAYQATYTSPLTAMRGRMRTRNRQLEPSGRPLTRSLKLPKGGLNMGFSRRLLREVNPECPMRRKTIVLNHPPEERLDWSQDYVKVGLSADRELLLVMSPCKTSEVTLMHHREDEEEEERENRFHSPKTLAPVINSIPEERYSLRRHSNPSKRPQREAAKRNLAPPKEVPQKRRRH